MKRIFLLIGLSLCGTAVVVAAAVGLSPAFSFDDLTRLAGSVFFVDSVTAEGLKEAYRNAGQGGGRLKILIVPGHDSESWGTEFRGVKEAEMTVEVGEELARLLSADPRFEVTLARTRAGYAPEFQEYFTNEKSAVQEFVAEKRKVMQGLLTQGSVEPVRGVKHNKAADGVVWRLYSFNKWANEHSVQLVLHIHFNDYPGRPYDRPGRYDGFALYVPEDQFSNAKASRAVAESLFNQFSQFYAESNLPKESSGIVPDQTLIAIGAYNTLDAASVLIEYGYIYEDRFLDPQIREKFLKELAFQTSLGLNKFFGSFDEVFRQFHTTLLPYEWSEPLAVGVRHNPSVLALQAALLSENLYPPEGDKRACPLTGSFGPCTERAVKSFQEKYALPPSGTLTERTRSALNEKYGN